MSPPIIQVRRAAERFLTRGAGLTSRHSFSFGEHYDPDNVAHGQLMVHNDELVDPRAGFDDHPHRDAEIVTWVLRGSLVHQDSAGHRGLVHPGLAARMSAGSGIVHSERNDAFTLAAGTPVEPAHVVQMWVRPDESGVVPSYAERELDPADLAAGWLPVASGHHPDAAVTLGARAATLWVGVLAPGASRLLPSGPLTHLYVGRGAVDVETAGLLAAGDSLRVTGEAALRVTARTEAELLVWELAA